MAIFSLLRRTGLLALLATLLTLAACAPGKDTRPEDPSLMQRSAWWEDPSGHASLQQVQRVVDWQPFTDWIGFGFGSNPIWFQLHLNAADSGDTTQWVVQVKTPLLDKLTLYDPATGEVQQLGNALSPADDAIGSINFTFRVAALAHERSIYLRLDTTGSRILHIDVLPFAKAQQRSRQQEWLLGFMVSLSLMFGVWALAQWWQTREAVIGSFAAKQMLSTVWAWLSFGFARVMVGAYLPDGTLTVLIAFTLPALVGSWIWFFSRLLCRYQPSRTGMRLCLSVTLIGVCLPVLVLFDLTREVRLLASILVVVAIVVLLVALLTANRSAEQQPIPYSYLVMYVCVYGMLTAFSSATFLGLTHANAAVLIGGVSCTFLDGIIMFIILQIRAQSIQQAHHQAALETLRSQEHAKSEQRQREEQGKLFAMLAHEMKTPLATLRMRMDTGQLLPDTLERAVTDMNQVIERCVYSAQLADQGIRPVLQPLDSKDITGICIQACRAPASVYFDAAHDLPTLVADAQMVSIVLSNLLDNACKYRAPNSQVTVSLKATAGSDGTPGLLWCVTNGVGRAGVPDTRQLFEKYYRSPQARRQSGSGLGLFLVKGLLELMQGTIDYAVQEDRITFRIWLPLATE